MRECNWSLKWKFDEKTSILEIKYILSVYKSFQFMITVPKFERKFTAGKLVREISALIKKFNVRAAAAWIWSVAGKL